jgi:signal peptidase I
LDPDAASASSSTRPQSAISTSRVVVAGCLSAVVPGLGQLLLKRTQEGVLFLSFFFVLFLLWWPVRSPFYWAGLIALIWASIGLCLVSGIFAISGRKGARLSNWWIAALIPLAFFAGAAHSNWMLVASGFRVYKMPSRSMEPTVLPGDHLVVDFRSYANRTPARGDLVAFRKDNVTLMKRVAAVGGDTIEGRAGDIFVNNKQLSEPYVQHSQPSPLYPEQMNFGPVDVPAGKLFVLGDNRENSYDSRIRGYGFVDLKDVQGRALYIAYSSQSGRLG